MPPGPKPRTGWEGLKPQSQHTWLRFLQCLAPRGVAMQSAASVGAVLPHRRASAGFSSAPGWPWPSLTEPIPGRVEAAAVENES